MMHTKLHKFETHPSYGTFEDSVHAVFHWVLQFQPVQVGRPRLQLFPVELAALHVAVGGDGGRQVVGVVDTVEVEAGEERMRPYRAVRRLKSNIKRVRVFPIKFFFTLIVILAYLVLGANPVFRLYDQQPLDEVFGVLVEALVEGVLQLVDLLEN